MKRTAAITLITAVSSGATAAYQFFVMVLCGPPSMPDYGFCIARFHPRIAVFFAACAVCLIATIWEAWRGQ